MSHEALLGLGLAGAIIVLVGQYLVTRYRNARIKPLETKRDENGQLLFWVGDTWGTAEDWDEAWDDLEKERFQ